MSRIEWVAFIISAVGTACWVVCFWWMHRISARQDSLLSELHQVTRRIEHLTREEHELIQEVHPGVAEIKKSVEEVAEETRAQKVAEQASAGTPM